MLLPSSHIMVVPAHMPLLTFSWPLGIFPPSSSSTPFSQRVSLEPPRCTPQGLRADTQDPTIQARCRTSGTVVDHGPQMAVLQMMKHIWIPKQTVVSVNVITRWRASGKVITMARALCFSPWRHCIPYALSTYITLCVVLIY